MIPSAMQDAIKLKASKRQWKEPVVKQHKVTAEQLRQEKEWEQKKRGGGGGAAAGGNGMSGADTQALRAEIDMLRQEMRNNIKQLKEQGGGGGGAPPPAAPAKPEVDKKAAEAAEALKREVLEVQSELESLRSVLQGVEMIPEELQELREDLKQVRDDLSAMPEPTVNGHANGDAGEAVEALTKDVRKVKSEIKELRLMVVQSQDGTALAKELRVTVEQQEAMLESHAEELDELKEQIRVLKRRLETAEANAQEAKERAERAPVAAAAVAAEPAQQPEDPGTPPPKIIPMSPTNRAKPKPPRATKPPQRRPADSRLSGDDDGSSTEDSDSSDEEQGAKFLKTPKIKAAAARSQKAQQEQMRENVTTEDKLKLLQLDSDEEASTDGSGLYPTPQQPPSEPLLKPRSGFQSEDEDCLPSAPAKEKTSFSPSSIVLDKNGTYNYKTEADSSESSESSSDSNSDDSSKKEKEPQNKPSPLKRTSSFDKDMEKIPRASAAAKPKPQQQMSSDTEDSEPSEPKKRTISLLPHRSESLYQEQRKDPVLRKFIAKGKTPDMTVHKVHGRNLVFFSDRVYIPVTLRRQTMEYYAKKHSYNPLFAIKKHCFWPDLEDDMKKYGKKDTKWKVEVVPK